MHDDDADEDNGQVVLRLSVLLLARGGGRLDHAVPCVVVVGGDSACGCGFPGHYQSLVPHRVGFLDACR